MAVPADAPVTIPDDEPTVATAVLLLLHSPPVTVSANTVVPPGQTCVVPVIVSGSGTTVTCTVVVSEAYPSFTVTVNESVPL